MKLEDFLNFVVRQGKNIQLICNLLKNIIDYEVQIFVLEKKKTYSKLYEILEKIPYEKWYFGGFNYEPPYILHLGSLGSLLYLLFVFPYIINDLRYDEKYSNFLTDLINLANERNYIEVYTKKVIEKKFDLSRLTETNLYTVTYYSYYPRGFVKFSYARNQQHYDLIFKVQDYVFELTIVTPRVYGLVYFSKDKEREEILMFRDSEIKVYHEGEKYLRIRTWIKDYVEELINKSLPDIVQDIINTFAIRLYLLTNISRDLIKLLSEYSTLFETVLLKLVSHQL